MPNPEGLYIERDAVILRLAVPSVTNGRRSGELLTQLNFQRSNPFDAVIGWPGRPERWRFCRDSLRAAIDTGKTVRIEGSDGDTIEIIPLAEQILFLLSGETADHESVILRLDFPRRMTGHFLHATDQVVPPGREAEGVDFSALLPD